MAALPVRRAPLCRTRLRPADPAESGWRLDQGKVTARDILRQGATAPVPTLVFCNACQSGQTDAWTVTPGGEQGVYGLANAFLLAGAQHYIGSVRDAGPAQCHFARHFIRRWRRFSVGEAVRHARLTLVERDGDASAVWASYVLYGDPTTRYLEPTSDAPEPRDRAGTSETVFRGSASQSIRRKPLIAIGISAILLVGLILSLVIFGRSRSSLDMSPLAQAYQALQQQDYSGASARFQELISSANAARQGQAYAGLAATAFAQGDYQQALDFAAQAERAAPETAYSHVIRGHIYLNRGHTTEAAAAYRTATTKSNVSLATSRGLRAPAVYAAQRRQSARRYDQALEQTRTWRRSTLTRTPARADGQHARGRLVTARP